jgi:hypothetical protein
MSVLTSPTLISTVYDVDMKSTGQTTLLTVPDAAYLIITEVLVIVTDEDTITVAPAVSVGISASYDEWIGSTTLTGLNATGEYASLSYSATIPVRKMFSPSDVVKIDVRTGATATTFRASIQVFGYFAPMTA